MEKMVCESERKASKFAASSQNSKVGGSSDGC